MHIGWVGTGVMGQSMAGHLLDAGHTLTVFSRTKSKAQPLLDRGAHWANAPEELASQVDVAFAIVGFPADVREVFLGPHGLLANPRPGLVVVDMTTSSPELAREISGTAHLRKCAALDAPVSGGDLGARNATLSIMVGGDPNVFEHVYPLFQLLGKTIVHQGPAGSGQHSKLANQILIASNMIGVCEALIYGYRAGLNLETLLSSVSAGAAGSWSLSNLAPRILKNDFEPGFFVQHFVKDLGIAISEAHRLGIALPGLALGHQLYVAVQAMGGGENGTQALQLALATLSGIDWSHRRPTENGPPVLD